MEKVKDICDEKADMFISFRPMNLTTEMLEYIGKRMKTAIWLSDDPVLYKTCYSQVVNHYDVLLHCGYKEVMDFYEANNHPKGFNFPFWTDHVAFPSVYNPLHSDYEIAFLGNMNGQVRRKIHGIGFITIYQKSIRFNRFRSISNAWWIYQ